MVKAGTKVTLKSNGENGIISDAWNPHLINPTIFKNDSPSGYNVITEEGRNHICLEADFVVN